VAEHSDLHRIRIQPRAHSNQAQQSPHQQEPQRPGHHGHNSPTPTSSQATAGTLGWHPTRCKLTAADTHLRQAGHPPVIYVREDRIVERLDTWLGDLLGTHRREATIQALHEAGDDPSTAARRRWLVARLRSCQDRLNTYRRALEAGTDPAVVAAWIAEVTAERTRHEIDLARVNGQTRLSREQITALVDQMAGLTSILRHADPRDRAEIYTQLQLRLTYQNERKIIMAEIDQTGHVPNTGVRGLSR
jgi:site-specific DNA recombinase